MISSTFFKRSSNTSLKPFTNLKKSMLKLNVSIYFCLNQLTYYIKFLLRKTLQIILKNVIEYLTSFDLGSLFTSWLAFAWSSWLLLLQMKNAATDDANRMIETTDITIGSVESDSSESALSSTFSVKLNISNIYCWIIQKLSTVLLIAWHSAWQSFLIMHL